MAETCLCEPCTSPAYGNPSLAHCAACCYGTGVVDYDFECPIEDHKALAILQHGTIEEKDELDRSLATEGKRLTPMGIESL